MKQFHGKYDRKKPKKRQPKPPPPNTIFDSSLRVCRYLKWEVLFSTAHNSLVRYLETLPNGLIRVATMAGIKPYDEPVQPNQLCRPTARKDAKPS